MNTPNGTLLIKHPNPARVNATFAPVLAEAQSLEVRDRDTASRAGELLRSLKAAERFLLDGDPASGWEGFAGPVKAAFDGHKFLCKLRDLALEPYRRAYDTLNSRLLAYESEERRKAEEAARAAEAAARQAEEERKIREALAAEEAGDKAAAEAIMAEPITAPSFAPAPPPKIEGRSVIEHYSAECTDLLALVRHVAQRPEDLNLLQPNPTALNALAKARKKTFAVPGCRLIVKDVARTRM